MVQAACTCACLWVWIGLEDHHLLEIVHTQQAPHKQAVRKGKSEAGRHMTATTERASCTSSALSSTHPREREVCVCVCAWQQRQQQGAPSVPAGGQRCVQMRLLVVGRVATVVRGNTCMRLCAGVHEQGA